VFCDLAHDPAEHVDLMENIYTLDALSSARPLATTLLVEACRETRKCANCGCVSTAGAQCRGSD
jgi:hypothetical protein